MGALSAIVETVSWRHTLEMASDASYQRRGQRIIVYEKFLSKLQTVLTRKNVGFDMEGGHDVAYELIMEEYQCWREDCKPIFVREDREAIGNWPVLAEKVKIWMENARQIAIGGYKRVS
jgi:hypothetical protein